MDSARLKIEETVLEASFKGAYELKQDESGTARLEIDVSVPRGGSYRLLLVAAQDYPSSMPEAYLIRPLVLRDCHGRELISISPSHEMHLLKPNSRFIRLCHYKQANWHPKPSPLGCLSLPSFLHGCVRISKSRSCQTKNTQKSRRSYPVG